MNTIKKLWGKFNTLSASNIFAYGSVFGWLIMALISDNIPTKNVVHLIICLLFAIYLAIREKQTIHVHIHDGKKEK